MTPHARCLADAIHPSSALRRIALLTVLLCTASLLALQFITHSRSRAQQLSLTDRIAAQRAIEQVYWQHRLWPKENPQPKPLLDEVLPAAALEAKVEEYLRQSAALAQVWQRPATADELQAEMERMARDTKQPEVLRELWAALGNDPLLIAECLARPALVERLVRERYEADETAALTPAGTEERRAGFETWWQQARTALPIVTAAAGSDYRLPQIVVEADACLGDKWTVTSTTGAPSKRFNHSAVWTGSEMIVWGGESAVSIFVNTGGRYNPATDTWASINATGAPAPISNPTAIWTGQEMIVWGGSVSSSSNSGGRYNPTTNTWTAMNTVSGLSQRFRHKVVWTGSEMIVWGGYYGGALNGGARYNPATNSWAATSFNNEPQARYSYTMVWTGSEVIVWGGYNSANVPFNSGGRYNPTTNSWTAVNLTGVPSGRGDHTAVWTGSEMLIWGGYNGTSAINTGGRFNPATNAWAALNSTNAPAGKRYHTAVWTGSEMIVWGTDLVGGRYTPSADSWGLTSVVNPPPGKRTDHGAVWTGNNMIVWGGQEGTTVFDSGGVYSLSAYALTIAPATKSFLAEGGTDTIAVTSPTGCAWTTTSNADWITINSGSSGAGNGTVGYSVAPNNTSALRTGTLSIGNAIFTVTQIINPAPTLTSLSPSSVVAGGPAFMLTVTGTNFVNSSVVRWNGNDRPTTFVSSTQLTAAISAMDIAAAGNASVNVFTPSPGGGLSTALNVAITCGYALTPAAQSFSTAGGTGTVNVTTGSNCAWTATSNAGWLSVTSGASGTGNGTVNYAVTPNLTNTARTGTLTIADKTFTVTQTGCSYALSATSQSFTAAGGTGNVSIASVSGCPWMAASAADWITITSGSSGSGDGAVNFSVAADTLQMFRTGTLTIAGQTFTVRQGTPPTNWVAQTSGTTNDLRSVHFISETEGWAAGSF